MSALSFQVCTPASNEHRRGLRWFSSLAQTLNQTPSIKHSIEFYSLYAQTGDKQYLERCEDFLRYSLAAR